MGNDKFEGTKEFKCGACGHTEAHSQMMPNGSGKMSDRILDIRNPALNSRIVFKACDKCHVIHGFWEAIDTSDISAPEKEKMDSIIKPEEKGKIIQ